MSAFHRDYHPQPPQPTHEMASDGTLYLAFIAGAIFAALLIGFFLELSR